ncbi:UHRF1-binding protein 1 isoform X1 [Alosa sapidissima]|uniref:UHRF1-binding protein 1 isoform X1 n=1 Tax=Alosa sapidissima TaxID=34773 RepID=UPI001C09E82D|nr:UHRF1-binding protein 1 isoform X1 [Alosa sapidissima]
MAGIIKKQILKHLSRFTKNLSPDKINLSTLKGEGQLSNLELDEEVLQNMLDLPTWLAVTRVYCNKAAIRIQWTKLKTSPICLFLDKVEVEMRTCEEPRAPNGPSPIAITEGQSEYGFAEKVVEGMSIIINSITIKVQARAFHASFELWQLQGNSLNPKWQRSDLRYTRITDPKRGEVLTFKEINWQSLRIEADAMESEEQDLGSTPLRLITNQGRIRIALKRRVKDCNVLASKLFFILDDLLWVLTDSQLKAIIHYAKSLSEAMEKSAQQRKSMAADSLQTAPPSPGIHTLWTDPPPTSTPSRTPNTLGQYFDLHDVKESSYHTFISRLDLHICNDSSSVDSDSDEPPPRGSQGAMQLTFRKLGLDYYPIHRPGDGCRHWERHCSAMESRAQWAAKLLQEFQSRVEASGIPGPHSDPSAPAPARESPAKKAQDGEPVPKSSPPDREQTSRRSSTAPTPASVPLSSGTPLKRLRSSCVVVRVDDLDIHQVSTGGRHSKKTQSLLSCNRKALHLADNVPAIHLQFTEYYFPNNADLPRGAVPYSNLYGQVNGLQLCVDPPSVLWMNTFARGLLRTLDQVKAFYHLQDSSKSDEHVDLRMDVSQLKVIIPLESSILDHPDRPQSLSISVPQMVLSNTRHAPHGSRADLASTYQSFSSLPFFQRAAPPSAFPCDRSSFHPLPHAFLQLSQEQAPCPLLDRRPPRSQDIWSFSLSRATLSFEGARRSPKGKTQPFVEPFAMAVWMCRPDAFKNGVRLSPTTELAHSDLTSPHSNHLGQTSGQQNGVRVDAPRSAPTGEAPEQVGGDPPSASVHILAQSVTPLKVWLNHFQYVALLRMKDTLAQLGAELSRSAGDSGPAERRQRGGRLSSEEEEEEEEEDEKEKEEVKGQRKPPSVCVAFLTDGVELGLLLPMSAHQPEEEEEARSPGETESPSMSDSDVSPTHRGSEPGPLEDSGIGGNGSTAPAGGAGEQDEEQEGSVEEACEALEEALDGEGEKGEGSVNTATGQTALSPPLSPGAAGNMPRDASAFSLEGELSSALNATKDVTKDALSASLDLTKGAFSITKDAFSMLGRSSGMTKMLFNSPAKELSRPEESSPSLLGSLRLQTMKQSPSQHSFDSAILDGSLPDDRLSVCSDTSENFAILMDSESGVESMRPESIVGVLLSRGSPAPGTEAGSSADLSSSLSQSIEDISQDMASVLLLCLSGVGSVSELKGEDVVVALEAQEMTPRTLGNQRVSVLLSGMTQGGVSSPIRPLSPAHRPTRSSSSPPVVALRMEMGPAAARHSPLSESAGFLELQVVGCRAELLASSLGGLGPFLEDELASDVQPMKIRLRDTVLKLKDNGPRVYPTAPQPVPVVFSLDGVVLERSDDGVFSLRPGDNQSEAEGTVSTAACRENGQRHCSDATEHNKPHESELSEAQVALAQALLDRERLLLEVQKYDPTFTL